MDFGSNVIHSAEDCTIKQFMDCCFKDKYKVLLIEGDASDELLKAAFEYIYAEYVDYAQLYQNREFEITAYIESLGNRMATVKRFIELQKRFISEFGCPYVMGFEIVEKYGYRLQWDFDNPNKEVFLKSLSKIRVSEKRYELEIDKKVKELVDLHKKKTSKTFTILESRKEFISMLTRLQQARYQIDREKTTVEELAICIRDQRDQQESERAGKNIKKR